MSLLKGSQTFTIYRVTEPAPKDAQDRLIHRAHRPNPGARTKEPVFGWVAIDDDTHVPDSPHFGEALAFACRIDRKRVPGRALKIAVEANQREVMKERGLERLGKNHKREIAEAVEEDLLQRVLPTITTVDVLWTGSEVYVFTSSATTADLVRGLFFDTFGVRLHPDRLGDWTGLTRDPEDDDPTPTTAASGFLGALVKAEDPDLWLDGKAAFSVDTGDGEVSRTALAGTINPNSLEAVDSVGQSPTLARFGLRVGESEHAFTLKVANDGLTFSGVKLPADVKTDTEPMVLEREFLLTRLVSEVRRRFIGWFAEGVES
jgi:hypothetical protein